MYNYIIFSYAMSSRSISTMSLEPTSASPGAFSYLLNGVRCNLSLEFKYKILQV